MFALRWSTKYSFIWQVVWYTVSIQSVLHVYSIYCTYTVYSIAIQHAVWRQKKLVKKNFWKKFHVRSSSFSRTMTFRIESSMNISLLGTNKAFKPKKLEFRTISMTAFVNATYFATVFMHGYMWLVVCYMVYIVSMQ